MGCVQGWGPLTAHCKLKEKQEEHTKSFWYITLLKSSLYLSQTKSNLFLRKVMFYCSQSTEECGRLNLTNYFCNLLRNYSRRLQTRPFCPGLDFATEIFRNKCGIGTCSRSRWYTPERLKPYNIILLRGLRFWSFSCGLFGTAYQNIPSTIIVPTRGKAFPFKTAFSNVFYWDMLVALRHEDTNQLNKIWIASFEYWHMLASFYFSIKYLEI